MKHFQYFLVTGLILLFFLANQCFAQSSSAEEDEIHSYPWESQIDYTYLDDASLFWNTFFRPGTGVIGINAIECQEFTTFGSFLDYYKIYKNNPTEEIFKEQENKVIDYWMGANFSGVVNKYVSFLGVRISFKDSIMYNLQIYNPKSNN